MKRVFLATTLFLVYGGVCPFAIVLVGAAEPNVLTEAEERAGFELLFNGRDLTGWEPLLYPSFRNLADDPMMVKARNWRVEDGAINFTQGTGFTYLTGLTYRAMKLPEDFELRFEWKESKAARKFDLNGRPSFEVRGQYGPTGKAENVEAMCAFEAGGRLIKMSTGWLPVAANYDVPSVGGGVSWGIESATRPVGQWNSARIVHQGSLFQHWVNDRKVHEIDCGTDRFWKETLIPWLELKKSGFYLGLGEKDPTRHGHPAWYRSIKVRPLEMNEKLDRTPVIVGEN